MTRPIARHLISKASGVGGTVYACPFCGYMERVPSHPPGRAPKGHGWRVAAVLGGALVQHMQAKHAPLVARSLELMRERVAANGWKPDTAKGAIAQAKRETPQ